MTEDPEKNLARVKSWQDRQRAMKRKRREYWATEQEHAELKRLLERLRNAV